MYETCVSKKLTSASRSDDLFPYWDKRKKIVNKNCRNNYFAWPQLSMLITALQWVSDGLSRQKIT